MGKNDSFQNIFDKTHDFIDANLSAIQGKEFRTASEVPFSFIEKKIPLRGQILNVCENGLLHVKHIPVINLPRFRFSLTKDNASNKGIVVKLAGISLSDKHQTQVFDELKKLKKGKVWMKIIHREQKDKEAFLHCLVSKQKIFSSCVNFHLLRLGLAQVRPLPADIIDQKLTDKLFKAQKKAVFWRRGIWKKSGS